MMEGATLTGWQVKAPLLRGRSGGNLNEKWREKIYENSINACLCRVGFG